jgi:hypothetical protein
MVRLPKLSVFLVALALPGCAYFGGAKTPSSELIDCYAAALEPAVGDVFDTAELARDLVSGKAKLGAVAANLELQEKVVAKLMADLNQCGAPHGEVEPASAPSETDS